MEPFYRTTYSRALHSLVINGFFARDVDADDLEFLEYVKQRGVANGSLPNTSAVLLEELDFWRLPYTIAPDIERRVGTGVRRRIEETPEQFEMRKARSNAWHARRIIRENEKALAAAELAREEREQAAAIKRRKLREIITDYEWEAAAPKQAPFGAVVDGRYVPEWKLEELGMVAPSKPPMRLSPSKMRQAAKEAAKLEALKEKDNRSMERAKIRAAQIAEELAQEKKAAVVAKLRKEAQASKAAKKRAAEIDAELGVARIEKPKQATWLTKKEISRRELVLQQARDNLKDIEAMERQWALKSEANYSMETLEKAVLTMLNSTPGQAWTPDTMMQSIGGCTRAFLDECLAGLVRQGRLRKMDMPP